ncbi:UV-stimulated scaffold protein A isoform X1 [Entelurus aequoreus]|uniref:UV-stimulated scaffold protein A isoform X1 n=1 Tax=Entelurus aequoreus TaxID=161455 RepID=UPI002B1E4CF5|nr:UV-stimulated scaffold protein A isoform X1 [Entelurus aequoreus]
MELSQRDRLSELVEEITTSGQTDVNKHKMKEVKKICKESNDCIDHVYHTIMSQLNQDHAEIRLSAFQLASELFTRSHHFRTLLVDNFQELLELTVETNFERPLPAPQPVARKLRSLAVQTIQSWQSSYGSAYKKLELGYHFLKQFKKVDFQDAEARTVAERQRERERQRKMEKIHDQRLKAATEELQESSPEIEVALTELDSCLTLLFPQFDFADSHASNNSDSCLLTQTTTACLSDDEQPCCSTKQTNNTKDSMQENKERSSKDKKVKKKKKKEGENEKVNCSDKMEGIEEGQSVIAHEEDGRCEAEEEPLHGDTFIQNSGLISRSYCLDLNISPGLHVAENEDNEAVLSTLLDLQRLLTSKHLPAVRRWVQVFIKCGAEQQVLKRALDLKRSLEAAQIKLNKLDIDCKDRVRKVVSSDGVEEEEDDDDDFSEVPEKEGYEPHIPEHLQEEYGLIPSSAPSSTPALPVTKRTPVQKPFTPPLASCSHSRRLQRLKEEERDPTSAAATLHLLRKDLNLTAVSSSSSHPSSTQSNTSPTTSKAPVVPFGLDLYYWGQDQPNSGKIIKMGSQHQFWVPSIVEEEVENKEMLAESKCRYISFPGKFTPVNHYCHVPIGYGKLCKRQDRLKCPFHGRIIPRDEEGRPSSQEERQREENEKRKKEETNNWCDAELVRDIEIQTGQDLGSDRMDKKNKKKKKKKSKYANLSNLKNKANTSRSRLENRIFNKSSMRRVAETLSKADSRKHDKFSNQFNYALN